MLLPLAIAGGLGWLAYEKLYKPSHPSSSKGAAAPSPIVSPASALAAAAASPKSPLVANLQRLAAPSASAAAPSSPASAAAVAQQAIASGVQIVSNPVLATASLAANALLHGKATDPSVQAAVVAFQLSDGLTADGKYGPKTQAALRQYIPTAPAAPSVYGGTG